MAAMKYPFAVKADGKVVPPNTEVEIADKTIETKSETESKTISTQKRRRTTKKKV